MLFGNLLADISFGGPTQPPGTEGLITMLQWGIWIVSFVGVIGVLIVGGAMALAHRRGEGSEAAGRLGYVMGGCVLAAAAGPLVNVFI